MADKKGSLTTVMIALLMIVPLVSAQQPAAQEGYFESFDGREIHWQSWRVENLSNVMVLIHGYDSSSNAFLKFAGYLNENNISAYAIDLRESIDSFENYTRDLKIFIDLVKEYESRNVLLLGQSMGGGVVLRYATEYPEDLEGVIASAPAIGMQISGISVSLRAVRLFYPALNAISTSAPNFSIYVPGIKNDISIEMLSELAENVLYLWENTDKISLPCLFVIGSEDQVISQKALRTFYEAVPAESKKLLLIEGADHFLFDEENAEKTFEALMG
jgi:alpha-beta hydrolase superfamily lysophospholipase